MEDAFIIIFTVTTCNAGFDVQVMYPEPYYPDPPAGKRLKEAVMQF